MPLPKPRRNESKNSFISRFVRQTKGEFTEKQALAVALKTWDDSKIKKRSK